LIYIRKSRLDAIDVDMGNDDGDAEVQRDLVQSRIHTGTSNYAGYLALPDALDFHEAIGAKAKEARLRHLRDRWAETVRGHGAVDVLTPTDPRLTCAITSFRLRGRTSDADNRALAADLLKRFNIFTVDRVGVAKGSCVRVTPALFTHEDEVDQFIAALKTFA
jgi:selenocysteine lyase/cysteine desulfurase